MTKKEIEKQIKEKGWSSLSQQQRDYYNSTANEAENKKGQGVSEIIYNQAMSDLGKSMCGSNKSLGCATTINTLSERAIGRPIGGGASTYWMYDDLKKNKERFKEIKEPIRGELIISPTGMGNAKKISNGHVGIILDNEEIASNDSKTGIFRKNYTIQSWRARWEKIGKYPVLFFRILS